MQRRVFALVCFVFASISAGSSAFATQIVYKSPEQMGQESSLVVRGRVASVESYWNAKHTKIFTRTRVAVDETYKGAPAGMVDVVQLGGVVDGVRVTVQGAVTWRHNEEVVLFLEPYQAGSYHVAGFSQGKFEVERDPDTGKSFVRRPAMEEVQFLTMSPTGELPPRASEVRRIPVDQFINQALGRNNK
jgi:hypothetical protein